MNRTDRLLAIVLELQAKRRQRAADLAATFETSTRTIYRDIQALCEAGVPIVAVPGHGYGLVEGYFLPPLRFTTDEAIMLLLGCDVMTQHFDAEYRGAAQAASRKIASVLPEDVQVAVRNIQQSMRFITAGTGNPDEDNRLQQLRRAILQQRTVRFHYQRRHNTNDEPAPQARNADPYGLVHVFGAWYLVAYCHVRQDIRHFRVERMAHLQLLSATFVRSSDFSLEQPEVAQRPLVVRVLFDGAVARWVRESRYFYIVEQRAVEDGLLVTLRVRHEREVVQWLLSWGQHVRIIEPDSLRTLLVQEARAMLHNFEQSESLLT